MLNVSAEKLCHGICCFCVSATSTQKIHRGLFLCELASVYQRCVFAVCPKEAGGGCPSDAAAPGPHLALLFSLYPRRRVSGDPGGRAGPRGAAPQGAGCEPKEPLPANPDRGAGGGGPAAAPHRPAGGTTLPAETATPRGRLQIGRAHV